MISTWVVRSLIYIYTVLAFISLIEKNIPGVRYWAGAALLTWGVLTMGGK